MRFSPRLWCLWEMRLQGLLTRNRCDAWGAFLDPCIEAELLPLLSGVEEECPA